MRTSPALFFQNDRLPDEVFDGAAQGVCERQYRGNRGTAQVELVLLVELYGAEFNSRLGGQLLLGHAGRLSCRSEAFLGSLSFVPLVDDNLGKFIFGGLMKRISTIRIPSNGFSASSSRYCALAS